MLHDSLSLELHSKSLSVTDLSSWTVRIEDGLLVRETAPGLRLDKSGLVPALQVKVDDDHLGQFVEVVDFLEVWSWNSHYDPEECGTRIFGGTSWSLSVKMDGRNCHASGENAYPSFADVNKTSLREERFGMLVAALEYIFSTQTGQIRIN
ncbi:hypothetical protein [Bremerella sp.]|uniref:hypothetical protein n=1 Tax=Bremerella sp. TaxID=2795602 RepID=UPI0039191746